MKRQRKRTGRGFVDKLINKLPVELHFPGYQFCGPGTKLQKRLKRGDTGVNELDKACKEHDIAYGIYRGGIGRLLADKKLARAAWDRVTSKDATLGERISALATTAAMRGKMNLTRFGGSLKQKRRKRRKTGRRKKRKTVRRRTRKTGKGLKRRQRKKKKNKKCGRKKRVKSFTTLVNASKRGMRKRTSGNAFTAALKSAHLFRTRNKVSHPRIIPVPKTGGVLPLLPIFAGLSALGALTGGLSNVVKSISDIRNARKMLEETRRHNRKMEAVPVGKGLYLKPYKRGFGLFLKPNQKN